MQYKYNSLLFYYSISHEAINQITYQRKSHASACSADKSREVSIAVGGVFEVKEGEFGDASGVRLKLRKELWMMP